MKKWIAMACTCCMLVTPALEAGTKWVSKQIVRLYQDYSGGGKYRDLGTAVIIDSEGYVLTAEHLAVYDNLYLRDTEGNFVALERLYMSKDLDFAILKAESVDKLPFVENVIPELDPQLGDTVYVVGFPGWARRLQTREGAITSFSRIKDKGYVIRSDADIFHGNSGGALVNDKGELVGITVWGNGSIIDKRRGCPVYPRSASSGSVHIWKVLNQLKGVKEKSVDTSNIEDLSQVF